APPRATWASRWCSSSPARSRSSSPLRRCGPGWRTARPALPMPWRTGPRVAGLRRTVRRLAETTLPGWRWTEPDDLAGLTDELGAITTRLRERLDGLAEG